jgi:ABC-2 type transport system ATP-binding protein
MVIRMSFTTLTPRLDPAANDAGGSAHQHPRTAIQVSNLSKSYGDRLVLDNVSFGVPTGAITGFIGPNGAGKTTTIRALLGFVEHSSGDATVLGESIDDPSAFLSKVGALIDSPAFYPGLSARQNLRLLADIGRIDHARIDAVLDIVGLTARADDAAKQYSLGMRQRLGIAAALLPDPELLVLDEPTNGLDPSGIQEIRSLLRQLANEGRTVLVSSHLLAELEHISDWIVVLKRGRVVYEGTVAGLSTDTEELVVAAANAADLPAVAQICDEVHMPHRQDVDRLIIEAPALFAEYLNRTAMQRGIVLIELSPRRASLEDAFFDLIEEGMQ